MLFKQFVFLSVLSVAAAASEVPETAFPAGMGVNIHFVRGQTRDLDMIAAAGFKWIRMDFAWESIERKRGEYDWKAYDELSANLEKRGLRAIYILDYSNPIYEEKVEGKNPLTSAEQRDTASPQHPESIAAFAKWAAAAAVHFKDNRIIWEIWNEPNISFWKPKPNAEQYTALAVAACEAIRRAQPDATIVGPATSQFDWLFIETFFKSGVLQYLDAVSVHPYRSPKQGPEHAAAEFQRLRGLIAKYGKDDRQKNLPILSGEWGYSSKTGETPPETQAAYFARQQLSNLLEGVPISIWYDWKNDGPDPNDHESNFGTVTHDLEPKPAYEAAKTLTAELSGYRILRRVATDANDYVLTCVNNSGGCKLVCWTTGEAHPVTIDPPFKSARWGGGVDGLGHRYTPKSDKGQWVIELEAMPKYLTAN